MHLGYPLAGQYRLANREKRRAMNRDTEADMIGGILTLAAAVFTGYVSHTLYAASSWLPADLYKDTFTLSAAVAIVAGGLALRGAYLLAYFVHGVRADVRRDRARRR